MAAAQPIPDESASGQSDTFAATDPPGYNQGMNVICSMDEAKARLPTILRQVRAGNMVTITRNGKAVAEIRPVEQDLRDNLTTEEWFDYLRQRGILSGCGGKWQPPEGVEPSPGALERFLAERG